MDTKPISGSAAPGVAGGGSKTAEHNPYDWPTYTFAELDAQLQEACLAQGVTVKSHWLGTEEPTP